jgi:bifunctional non-homologous end joining protein LigD
VSPRAQAPGGRRLVRDTQPGLPIAVPAAGVPGRLTTEASTPCSAPFDGDDWLFSVDWAGSRCLLVADGDGTIRLHGENAPLDDRFPEIVAAASFCAGRTAILDGTICVLDGQGRPDLGALFRRVAAGQFRPPAVYLVTDLLHLDGESMAERPLLARLAVLSELIPPESSIQLPDHVVGHGRALASAAGGRGLAAMLARRQDSRYQSGMASPDRLRVALSPRRDAVVIGWRDTASGVGVVLGDWAQGRLRLVGTALVEDQAARRWLAANADPATDAAVDDPGAAGPGVTWVRPRLVATVDPAAGGRPGGALPEWQLVALRDDVDPMWCVRRAPVDPPRASAHQPLRPFSPTVLNALPMDRTA